MLETCLDFLDGLILKLFIWLSPPVMDKLLPQLLFWPVVIAVVIYLGKKVRYGTIEEMEQFWGVPFREIWGDHRKKPKPTSSLPKKI